MRIAMVVGVGLLGACVPNDHPSWLVDHPIPWGIVASVVEPGGYSSELVVPADRVRASALPLDTLELQWLTATPPGVTVPPPIWFVCPGDCSLPGDDPVPACPFPLPLGRRENCRLGEGERIRLSLGGAYTADEFFRGYIGVLGVTGDGTVDAETCLQRLRTIPRTDLEQCLVQKRLLELGPRSRLLTAVPTLANIYTVEDPPADLADEPPDFHPVLTGIRVRYVRLGDLVDQLVQSGDTVHVPAGRFVFLQLQYTDDSEQSYYAFSTVSGEPNHLQATPDVESIRFRTAISSLVEVRGDPDNDMLTGWRMPDESEPILVYFYMSDQRQGRAFATLRFVVEDASPAP
ncbi:hypothetical protein [Nannocystis punicea]|uniref:Uncharacterized protein n=1 Tax=Nannocystis punicea TaxID=2995304 RepID=A0ABY7HEJ0_9BACT|nr:hypothetical protein [Nannocystis poenicansa]WAS97517.1 hypothetical protein O0S08_15335 [Nannocystis poenicansa]